MMYHTNIDHTSWYRSWHCLNPKPVTASVRFGSKTDISTYPLRCSPSDADDRLPRASLLRVERADGFVEARDGADVRPEASVPHPLDDLAQLRAIGLDDEIDRQAVGGPRLDRTDDGHQGSSGPDHRRGPFPDVAADEIEHQVDSADVFELVILEVDELVRAEVERLLAVGVAAGADDPGAGLPRKLRHHRT